MQIMMSIYKKKKNIMVTIFIQNNCLSSGNNDILTCYHLTATSCTQYTLTQNCYGNQFSELMFHIHVRYINTLIIDSTNAVIHVD